MEITRFEILDHVMNELKFRTLLWENVISWGSFVDEWQNIDFNTLNADEVTLITIRMLKDINQLEKYLLSNNVVPILKDSVELIKNKLPVIGYLRNPNLKQRHWLKIESLLGYRFKPEEILTWNLLESLGVFLYPTELMEISAAATSEATLESMLNKVKQTWRNQFNFMNHSMIDSYNIINLYTESNL